MGFDQEIKRQLCNLAYGQCSLMTKETKCLAGKDPVGTLREAMSNQSWAQLWQKALAQLGMLVLIVPSQSPLPHLKSIKPISTSGTMDRVAYVYVFMLAYSA
ncbi:hypothetical protein MHYP_G00192690 [Metynnis hypsauchen]